MEYKEDRVSGRCLVCNGPASSCNYGVVTCDPCRVFFYKACNTTNIEEKCQTGGNCKMNEKCQSCCRPCRLQKCQLVGMNINYKIQKGKKTKIKHNVNNETVSARMTNIGPMFHGTPSAQKPQQQQQGSTNVDYHHQQNLASSSRDSLPASTSVGVIQKVPHPLVDQPLDLSIQNQVSDDINISTIPIDLSLPDSNQN